MNSVPEVTAHKSGVSSLWWGWVAAPAWWLTQFEIRYALVHWSCTHDLRSLVPGVGVAAVIVSFLIVLWSIRCFKAAKDDETMRFVSVGAVWLSVGFAVLTAVQILPDIFIELCRT